MPLTGTDNWFEDFVPGDVFRHARGKTVTEMDNVMITNMAMNTAQNHFNEHFMRSQAVKEELRRRVVFGGVTVAMVIGLAAQDTGENVLAEIGMDKIRLMHPVFHGDTLYAYSQVLEVRGSDRAEAGIVRFKHWGVNQDDAVVFEGERTVLMKRRASEASV